MPWTGFWIANLQKKATKMGYLCSEKAFRSTVSTKQVELCSKEANLSTRSTKQGNLCSEKAFWSTGSTKLTDLCSKEVYSELKGAEKLPPVSTCFLILKGNPVRGVLPGGGEKLFHGTVIFPVPGVVPPASHVAIDGILDCQLLEAVHEMPEREVPGAVYYA